MARSQWPNLYQISNINTIQRILRKPREGCTQIAHLSYLKSQHASNDVFMRSNPAVGCFLCGQSMRLNSCDTRSSIHRSSIAAILYSSVYVRQTAQTQATHTQTKVNVLEKIRHTRPSQTIEICWPVVKYGFDAVQVTSIQHGTLADRAHTHRFCRWTTTSRLIKPARRIEVFSNFYPGWTYLLPAHNMQNRFFASYSNESMHSIARWKRPK